MALHELRFVLTANLVFFPRLSLFYFSAMFGDCLVTVWMYRIGKASLSCLRSYEALPRSYRLDLASVVAAYPDSQALQGAGRRRGPPAVPQGLGARSASTMRAWICDLKTTRSVSGSGFGRHGMPPKQWPPTLHLPEPRPQRSTSG